MGQSIIQVDAFTVTPFAGNPAAVCILTELQDEVWMQRVANEMNLSETAFLLRQPNNSFHLRWFTPTVEVELCGHATLASAHVLWSEDYIKSNEQICFRTLSGLLTATLDGTWIELDFPAKKEISVSPPTDLLKALGIEAVYIGQNKFDYLVEVESEEIVRDMRPNFSLLETISARGVIVTSCASTKEYDFVSRFFAPRVGVNEDPVTGSAHCCLAPYWSKKLGKDVLIGYQASARGGIVRVRMQGDRVHLGGQAVTVMRGELVSI